MSKEQSAIIKGFAILFVFIAHLGCIHGIQGLDNYIADSLEATSQQAVFFFLVVSGYGLYYVYHQGRMTWSYLFKRTLKLYLAYWLILLIFVFGIASWLYPERYHYPWHAVLLNFVGWRWDYCKFTWFLLPYILMCLSARWVIRVFDRIGIVFSLIGAIALYMAGSFLVSYYYDPWLRSHYMVYHLILWVRTLLGFTVGASMARRVFDGKSIVWSKLAGKNAVVALLLVLTIGVRGLMPSAALNPFHATLLIWLLLHFDGKGLIKKLVVELGDKCMILWLAQGFLGVYLFSEYLVQLRWPLLIYIVWVMVTYVVACLLKPVINSLAKALRLT